MKEGGATQPGPRRPQPGQPWQFREAPFCFAGPGEGSPLTSAVWTFSPGLRFQLGQVPGACGQQSACLDLPLSGCVTEAHVGPESGRRRSRRNPELLTLGRGHPPVPPILQRTLWKRRERGPDALGHCLAPWARTVSLADGHERLPGRLLCQWVGPLLPGAEGGGKGLASLTWACSHCVDG